MSEEIPAASLTKRKKTNSLHWRAYCPGGEKWIPVV
jgi:hypothetical protein